MITRLIWSKLSFGQIFDEPSNGDADFGWGVLLQVLSAVERDMVAQVLADCAGNKSKAATRLGISRTQLYVRLRRYQLS